MKHIKHAVKVSIISAAALCSVGAFAEEKLDGQWRGTAGAALSTTSGNSSTTAFNLNADTSRATTADKISLSAYANYGKNKVAGVSTTTANKWGGFGQYDYNLSERLFGFGRLGLEGDGVIDLDLRAAVAAGLGYKVFNGKDTQFTVYGGLGYTKDKYGSTQLIDGKSDTSFSRTSLYLAEESVHQLSSTVAFKQRLDLYPGLTGDKAKLAKFTAGLSVAMSSTLNLTVGLVDNYNSKPAAGLKKNDLGIFTGVNVKFGAL
jgi:putative salt-induced outer membrane protein